MLNKLFKKYTIKDLLAVLRENIFDISKADSIKKGVNIHHKDQFNRTLMHILAQEDLVESIKWLAMNKVDVNGKDSKKNTPLIYAAKFGSTETIKVLLQLKANPNLKNVEGKTAIQEALRNNQESAFFLLKDNIKNIDNKDQNIIFDAIDSKNFNLVKEVLKLQNNDTLNKKIIFYPNTYIEENIAKFFMDKFDINATDEYGKIPIFYLIKYGTLNSNLFNFAIKKGLNIKHVDNQGNNILMTLIKKIVGLTPKENTKKTALLEMIPWLIDENIDYNLCNDNDDNPLIYAAKHGGFDVMKALLNCDIDPNYINNKNETALNFASLKGRSCINLVSLLLEHGARGNINDSDGKTIIERLIEIELYLKNNKKLKMKLRQNIDESENYKVVFEEILLNGEVNLNMLNSEGNPYFFEAVKYGNIEIVKTLVKYGADINLKNNDGNNIIHYYISQNTSFRKISVQQSYLVMLRNILNIGADVNSRDNLGRTALHEAILNNDIQTIKILINSGADLDAVDNKGRNIVHNAMWQNKLKVFRLLYSYNKKLINKPDKFGVLPINYAAFLGYDELVIELIDSGSHVNNPYKKTEYILNFLEKFHKNLETLVEKTKNPSNYLKVKALAQNMTKEFNIKEFNTKEF